MKILRFESFVAAFIVQKIAEYVLLSLCLAVQLYLGTRLPDPTEWGIYGQGNVNFSAREAIEGGLGTALVFFLFTLYPVVTLVVVGLARRQNFLPWVSAAVSVGYVLLWVASMKYDPKAPFWIITAIMAAFIVASSALLYPRVPPAEQSA